MKQELAERGANLRPVSSSPSSSLAHGTTSSYRSSFIESPARVCRSHNEMDNSPKDVKRVLVDGHHASQKP
ncbi:UNVERIFIED_CONTAM: hypothetical protein Slati_0230900 [Sesamum latifolium]|uniref:Uncharacterized protein n=1 Tax=Sesamum latifolium TaxID=2727402 RepID=A0AAW2YCJ1_9LAMI